MGNHMSKKPTNNLPYTSDHLNSYEAACRLDVDLQSFDTTLQTRTADVINSLAAGVEVRALSFESLKQTTECLLELNQEVVKNAENADVANATLAFSGATLLNGKMEDLIRTRSRLALEARLHFGLHVVCVVILDCKKDIWKNQDLFDLVEEYFDNSLKTLDFCAALEKCLKRARDSQLLIKVVLQQFDDEEKNSGDEKYSKTLEELKNFKDAGDPFSDEFFQVFQSVYLHQIQMLEKLQLKKNKLDRKLRYIRSWRRVSSIIFAATFAAVLICSVVAAAIAAPPLAAALSAAASIPLGSMGKWIDSLLVSCEAAVRGQKEIVSCMNVGTYVAIKDLDNIRVLIRRLEVDIEAIVENAGFANSDSAGAHVKIVVDEIKKNLEVFMENTEELGVQADNCSRDIRRARTVILQRIIKYPQHFN